MMCRSSLSAFSRVTVFHHVPVFMELATFFGVAYFGLMIRHYRSTSYEVSARDIEEGAVHPSAQVKERHIQQISTSVALTKKKKKMLNSATN